MQRRAGAGEECLQPLVALHTQRARLVHGRLGMVCTWAGLACDQLGLAGTCPWQTLHGRTGYCLREGEKPSVSHACQTGWAWMQREG